MILCVQGPRPILQDTPTVVPLNMPTPSCLQSALQQWDPRKDLRAIASTFCYLEISGWYWGGMTASDAQAVLQAASEGTFLVRDSSHPHYMLTLSVKTKRGPTNVRIQYSCGRFQLDSSSPARPRLLSFPDISSLVQHYVGSGRGTPEDGRTGMDEVEEQGNTKKRGKEKEERDKADTEISPLVTEARDSAVLLKLKRPLCKPQAFPSLQHLTRLTINKHVACSAHLPLPGPLLRYIQEYPFQL